MPIMPLSFFCLDLLVAGGYPEFKFCYSLKDDSTALKLLSEFPFSKSKVRQYKKTHAHCRHIPLLTDNIIAQSQYIIKKKKFCQDKMTCR